MSNLPQVEPTIRAHASEGDSRERRRTMMKSSLNNSVMSRHTCSSLRWSRAHVSPSARATLSSFVSLWKIQKFLLKVVNRWLSFAKSCAKKLRISPKNISLRSYFAKPHKWNIKRDVTD